MISIQIPEEIETAVNEKAALQVAQSLAVEIAEKRIKPHAAASTVIDGEFLVQCLTNEMERRAAGGKESAENFFSAINRPDVFLSTRQGNRYVRTFQDLMTFASSIASEDITLEKTYTGYDHQEVVVLRVKIPSHYTARVAYVRMRHIPKRYLTTDDSVLVKMLPPKNRKFDRGELTLLCRELQPVWSDRNLFEIKKETIMSNYHFVTMKIRKADCTIKSWFPGVDKHCNVCSSLDDQFVLVGQQYHQQNERQSKSLTLEDLK